MLNSLKNTFASKKLKPQPEEEHNYSIRTLIWAHRELQAMSLDLNAKNRQKIIENIEIVTEYAVWGDQNDSSYWDYFCEQNILALMAGIMKRSKFKDVIIEIIQSISILVSNINQNLNYILSNPAINEFIIYYYNFTDEDICDYYVSLLKSITIRMNKDNISLFFNERLSYFPVLWQAQKFYNHKEVMVRTAVRAVILGVMKIENKQLTQYLTQFPFITFYANFMSCLRNCWMDLNSQILKSNTKNLLTLKEMVDDQMDLCYFLSDLYAFCPQASDILDNALINYCIIPILLNGFLYDKKYAVQIPLGMFLLTQCLKFFKNSKLGSFIIQILLSSQLPQSIVSKLETKISPPVSYSQSFSFKTFWDLHFDFVLQHSNQIFTQEIQEPNVQKNQADYEYLQMAIYLGIGEEVRSTDNVEKKVDNPLMTITTQFLTTKDDRLLYLTIKMLEEAVKADEVPINIRLDCMIVPNEPNILSENKDIVSQLLRIVQVDPPMRLCTVIVASQLLIRYCQGQDVQLKLDEDNISALMDSYYYSVNKLISQIKNTFYWENIITVFDQYTQIYKHDLQKIKTVLDYQSLVPNFNDLDQDVDQMYRLPTKIKDRACRDLAIFLIINKLKCLNDGSDCSNQNNQQNITNDWKVGSNYEPDQRKLLPCTIQAKTIRDKFEKCDLGQCYLVEDDDNFILVTPEVVHSKWAHVQYIYKLKDVEAVIDRAEPRLLIVSVTDKNYIDLQIYFEDHTLTLDAKRTIDSKRQLSKSQNLDKILEIFHGAKQECITYYQDREEKQLKRQLNQPQ